MDRAHLYKSIAAVIADIGMPSFPVSLAALLREIAPFDFTVIFGYRGSARPIDLFDDFPGSKRKIFVADYQAGPYLLDPFYLAATQPAAPALYRLRELAPDRFYQGEYFRSYYVQTGLAEEIGYFIDIDRGAMVVLSLMRAEKPFSAKEFSALDAARPVVQSAARRHWSAIADRFNEPTGKRGLSPERLAQQSFHSFAEGLLTTRERQIVEYTLKGYSADATGRVLGISSGTVRIHRRNVYAKLGIGSQGELFARFFGTAARG